VVSAGGVRRPEPVTREVLRELFVDLKVGVSCRDTSVDNRDTNGVSVTKLLRVRRRQGTDESMVSTLTFGRLVAGIVLLFGNGYFVTTEFAMTRIRQFPEEEFHGQGRGLERAWEMTERLEIYLSGCQVGITVCSVGLGFIGEPAVTALFDAAAVALGLAPANTPGHTTVALVTSLALINILHVIVGEQAPTYLGVERTKFVTKYCAIPLYWWTRIMWPVILVSDRAAKALLGLFGVTISRSWAEEEAEGDEIGTRGEIRSQMGEMLTHMGLPSERREEVLNALEIGDTPVSDIMVDIDNVTFLSTADPLSENLDKIHEAPHVRYPLVGESAQEYEGIVYTPLFLRRLDEVHDGSLDLGDVAAPPLTVTADTAVSELIDRFQEESQELALVLRGGEVVGMVTATDAFETITGELEDPIDEKILSED
jgi:CBS domain containing-hemolysin-like protein